MTSPTIIIRQKIEGVNKFSGVNTLATECCLEVAFLLLSEESWKYKKIPQYVDIVGFIQALQLFVFLRAEAGGFEPPVQLPVRQFSKLVVSATHPHFLKPQKSVLFLNCDANIIVCFDYTNSFLIK